MRLSKREIEVAELVAWGASDKEIAEELFIAVATARTHRQNILRKLNAHNSQDITRWYFQYKQQVFFGFNPRQVRHIAWLFLVLALGFEFSQVDALRASRARIPRPVTRRVVKPRPATRTRQDLKLTFA